MRAAAVFIYFPSPRGFLGIGEAEKPKSIAGVVGAGFGDIEDIRL